MSEERIEYSTRKKPNYFESLIDRYMQMPLSKRKKFQIRTESGCTYDLDALAAEDMRSKQIERIRRKLSM